MADDLIWRLLDKAVRERDIDRLRELVALIDC